jgi:type IV pilus assembly protein PilB
MATAAMKYRSAALGDQMIADGLIDESQLQQALENQKQNDCMLGQALVTLGFVPATTLGQYLEKVIGFPFVDLADSSLNSELARLLPESLIRRKLTLPFAERDGALHIAMADPLDLAAIDDLRARLNRRIVPFLALENDIQDAIARLYDNKLKTQSVLDEIAEEPSAEPDITVDELMGMAEDAPIVRLVNSILQSAIATGASDIHIEPQETSVRVRFRQDGLLYEQTALPRSHLAAVVSRLKIMSRMNIAERRRPQDGRFSISAENGNSFDLRVSIMPVVYGEKIVMRILAKTSSLANQDKLGFFPDQRRVFEKFIMRPHGIILVTGPTGSGKSTTLFAALSRINDSTRNINTVEDPVEYDLKGVNQMQINPLIGVTFAAGLRTLLRQDPDVIMVGEIRDRETAEIAVQAALTGHLVLSSLHTNDAPGALTRLQNMGVEPFLISSAVIGIVGQRLLRTICSFCKEMGPMTPSHAEALELPFIDGYMPEIAHGVGCSKCGGRGMRGRTAVYEIMPMTDALRDLVLQGCSGPQLLNQAFSDGMMTMRKSALFKVLEGITTPEEVMRVLYSEE